MSKSNLLRSIGPRQLSCVRGGVLYPAVKLLDMSIGVETAASGVMIEELSLNFEKLEPRR